MDVVSHTYKHTRIHTRTHTHAHTYTHTHTHTHRHTLTQTHTSLWLKEEVYCMMNMWICNWWIMLLMCGVKKCEWVSECTLLQKDACYLNKRPIIMCLAKKQQQKKPNDLSSVLSLNRSQAWMKTKFKQIVKFGSGLSSMLPLNFGMPSLRKSESSSMFCWSNSQEASLFLTFCWKLGVGWL